LPVSTAALLLVIAVCADIVMFADVFGFPTLTEIFVGGFATVAKVFSLDCNLCAAPSGGLVWRGKCVRGGDVWFGRWGFRCRRRRLYELGAGVRGVDVEPPEFWPGVGGESGFVNRPPFSSASTMSECERLSLVEGAAVDVVFAGAMTGFGKPMSGD
jgi:hypothetical protein